MPTKDAEYSSLTPVDLMHAAQEMHNVVAGYNRCVSDIKQARKEIIELTGQVKKLRSALEKVLPLVESGWVKAHPAEVARMTKLTRNPNVPVAEQPNDIQPG